MNAVNKTLFIPLYGKAQVSKKGILLHDPMAEEIWSREAFPLKGKARSKWLSYNMAMRARVFDDWTRQILAQHPDATVLHIGCGLDSRCLRLAMPDTPWIDCDLPDVIAVRKKYYHETSHYSMKALDAASQAELDSLPEAPCAVVILEGLSMYLPHSQLADLLCSLRKKYREAHILMDVYTVFGAKASRYKNPVNDVGVTALYGVDDVSQLLDRAQPASVTEHSFFPPALVRELSGFERWFFRVMFTGSLYQKIYRLFELTMP